MKFNKAVRRKFWAAQSSPRDANCQTTPGPSLSLTVSLASVTVWLGAAMSGSHKKLTFSDYLSFFRTRNGDELTYDQLVQVSFPLFFYSFFHVLSISYGYWRRIILVTICISWFSLKWRKYEINFFRTSLLSCSFYYQVLFIHGFLKTRAHKVKFLNQIVLTTNLHTYRLLKAYTFQFDLPVISFYN